MSDETASLDRVVKLTRNLAPDDKLRLIGLVSEDLRAEMEQGSEPVDTLSLAGLGAEVWQKVDVRAYLDGERDSWER